MNNRTWDDEATLIGYAEYTEDELGQQIPIEKETTVFCCRDPVARQEFYLAGQNDIKVSEILIVHPYEYNGENVVVFNDQRLYVLKTYQISMEELELTCTEKIGDKNERENQG